MTAELDLTKNGTTKPQNKTQTRKPATSTSLSKKQPESTNVEKSPEVTHAKKMQMQGLISEDLLAVLNKQVTPGFLTSSKKSIYMT